MSPPFVHTDTFCIGTFWCTHASLSLSQEVLPQGGRAVLEGGCRPGDDDRSFAPCVPLRPVEALFGSTHTCFVSTCCSCGCHLNPGCSSTWTFLSMVSRLRIRYVQSGVVVPRSGATPARLRRNSLRTWARRERRLCRKFVSAFRLLPAGPEPLASVSVVFVNVWFPASRGLGFRV